VNESPEFTAAGSVCCQGEKNTNHALVGGGGDGRQTEAARLGLPGATTLPPDMLRDRDHVQAATERQVTSQLHPDYNR